ncbi:MAG: hypothetical protein EOP38_16450 [Rubrivivax sp.]|nr:MAG: hypothetical protein EOP38_16450 [Rubrivivax sp.]
MTWLAVATAASLLATPAWARQTVCVFDIVGASGPAFSAAKDFAVAVQKWNAGIAIDLKAYTDERVAVEDFRAGQCDAVAATSFRTKPYNLLAATVDAIGATTFARNGKLDMDASYEVLRRAIEILSSPNASKLMVNGQYEVAGIVPIGAAYPIVNDRKINSVEAAAGKRIAALDVDKVQTMTITRIGAQPVASDITNFASKFNNGNVDVIFAPALAYKPLELYKGIGTKGAISRMPVTFLTYQIIINSSKFPPGTGLQSRQYWLNQFAPTMVMIRKAEAELPPKVWMDIPSADLTRYLQMLRDGRVEIAEAGFYDKRGLKILKRIRCDMNPADSECTTSAEIDWPEKPKTASATTP